MDDVRPVVIYDGRCRFCVGQARRLERWVGGRVRLESFRDPGVLARYPGLTAEACDQAMQLVLADGRVYSGADAVARALALRPLLAPLAALYRVPGLRRLADRLYALIARNRFRIGGEVCDTDACHVHDSGR